ncbi:MAG: alpha-L-glutamate ligase-like protein [Thermodesulfobacteriota bacterium]
MLVSPARLRKAGIVGMNHRNVKLIAPNNPRRLYPLVDDKLRTKELVSRAGLATPRLLGVVRSQGNVRELGEFLAGLGTGFVIKPAKGSGGRGILVVAGLREENFVKPSGELLSLAQVQHHASSTVSGLFSLGGRIDVAMIEEMVHFSNVFDGFSYQGVPDVRVIVYKGYPVMAMTRLSTRASDGKANLHQGAVGLGIDLATGQALAAVQHGRRLSHHPDTGRLLTELAVPRWPEFVRLASSCFEISGLGYLGVDIVLDRHKGPQILELNARPGLAIQVANGHGLMARLALVDGQVPGSLDAAGRAAFAMARFAASPQVSPA